MECTMVIGGLREHNTIEEAGRWISDELWTAYGPQPCSTYSTGVFKGIAYARFENKQSRDAAVKVFEILKKRDGGTNVWAKMDQPINTQVLHSFCYGLRWQLGEWGYPKKEYYIDNDTWIFHALGKEILQASVKDGQIELKWKNTEWENWAELKNSTDFRNF